MRPLVCNANSNWTHISTTIYTHVRRFKCRRGRALLAARLRRLEQRPTLAASGYTTECMYMRAAPWTCTRKNACKKSTRIRKFILVCQCHTSKSGGKLQITRALLAHVQRSLAPRRASIVPSCVFGICARDFG